MQLADKIILITGGASGIGAACAKAYAREGAIVFIIDKDQSNLESLLMSLGGKHNGFCADVKDGTSVKNAIDKCLQFYGKLDVIHNNAGIASPSKPLHETLEDEWEHLFSVNLKTIYWTTKFGLEALKITKGCILNTSSMVGEIGQENHAAYVATKGGMNALTKAMALDYAGLGIRVNAISPAAVWTPLLRNWSKQQPNAAMIEDYLNHIHALGYCPEADVIADTAVFLVSNAARFITGCIMPISGGAELGYKKSFV